jgi:hypothetical protein
MVRPQLDEWRAESIRFTYFFAGEVAENLRQGLWRSITGLEPESSTRRPAEGVTQEQGPFLAGQLSVAVGVNRIDFILGAIPLPNDFPDLGNVHTVADEFRRAVVAGAAHVEAGANRLAYGLVCTRRCQNREDSYLTLNELLPSVTVDPTSRDFFYQINRPRRSNVHEEITLNRLSRWAGAVLKLLLFDGRPNDIPDVHVVRVELDFNTAAETPTPARGDVNGELMAELVAGAETLLLQGEH